MKTIFVCNTIYHILITLIFIKDKPNNYCILIDEKFAKSLEYKNKITKIFNIETKVFSDQNIYPSGLKLALNHHSEFVSELIKEANKIYLFNDLTNFAYYLHKNKINFTLMEDGYNYQKMPDIDQYTILEKIIIFLKRKIKRIPMHRGYSKYCTEINVNSIDGIKKDTRYLKFMEMPRIPLFNKISDEKKEKLITLFNAKPLSIQENSAIVITQPLYKHNILVNSTKEQYNFYKEVISKLQEKNYTVYIKVHPRDDVNYMTIPNVTIIDPFIPLEIIDIVIDKDFEIGITHSSTALNFISCIKKRILLFAQEEFKTKQKITI